ncbi:phosphatidylserine/phosphatidylglycerophosphate/cardiolipin synthase family protein [Phenylobacterium sp.]|uniref:phospholipase D-like domain-containing protein n=1 Tax=Phenylobacterium sp. TaxID=1871053 RepID=UPI002718FC74|nr:phosphatidylserine/phosphatidylglycerophosphate/cardiolipin synthase family protein [Phenylobacterium sp.]MDO8380241.1 phosphatidylserine/phosphatidylglycerophosphate/cardiolipin synthase family protein [Phenylobacterium sp.]
MTQTTLATAAIPHIPFVESGSYPVRSGNLVRPLVDGEPAFRRICEAVEAAQHSVWLTVAFLHEAFEMPDGRGSLFDVLDRAAARGVDVRAIFWRVNPESQSVEHETFSGLPHQHAMLRGRDAGFRARWDRGQKGYCQHQKSWLIDAGCASETAFIGGINLGPEYVVAPGHRIQADEPHIHDVYVEVTGPAATDVHHNFVQRWNEASDRGETTGSWNHDGDDLAYPTGLSAPRGEGLVQIQRTVRAGHYADGRPSPEGQPFDIAAGERSIFDQYQLAIEAAQSSIYIENQALGAPATLSALKVALVRGVEVVVLTPAEAYGEMRAARQRPESKPFFDQLAELGSYERFALVGIAGPTSAGGRQNVYVHAKIMLIDDAWATIGSCNIAPRSFFGDTEMNATFWDPPVVAALRRDLLAEHLEIDTTGLDDRAALGLYRQVATANRLKREAGDADWQGIAFALDPATYGA